jgi:hopanoid biosynthesis associated RND transporter like protein HpnN
MSHRDSVDVSPSPMAEALRGLTHAVARRPWWTLLITTILTTACMVYTARELTFKTDRSDLIDPSAAFHQRWLRYTRSFGESSDLVVVVESDEPEFIKQTLDRMGERLREHPELFSNILYKVEPGELPQKGLQYLPPESLAVGLDRLDEYRPIIGGRWDLVRLESLIPLLRYQLYDLQKRDPEQIGGLLHHAGRLSESLARFAEDRHDFINPWPEILPIDPALRDQGNQTVYMLNEAGTMGFLMAAPAKKETGFEGATTAIDTVRELIVETQAETPEVKILLTGIPVLENDEMRRSQADSTKAGLVSFIGVSLLFLLGFRGFLHPTLGMIVLAVGTAWSFGFAALVVGHLNILSVAFASIVIGLGNDFAIHLLSRYLTVRHHGRDVRHALVDAAGSIGPGIVTGAVTTALAFFCASFTSFLGVAELGMIAGGGLLLCTVATFTVLPALVALADRRSDEHTLPVPFQGRWLRFATSNYPGTVLTVSCVLLLLVGWGSFDWSRGWPRPKLIYDHNLLNLQAEGLESVEAQKQIFEASNNSLLYAVSLADSAEDARKRKEQFLALPTVRHVEELATRLPPYSPAETKLLVQAFHAQLARLPKEPPPPRAANPAEVGRMLDQFHRTLKSIPSPEAQPIVANLDRFLNHLSSLDIRSQMALLGEYQYRLAYSLLAQFQALEAASDPDPVTTDDLPPELIARYVSPQGQWLLQVFPKDQVWDMEPLERFVGDVRSVDPEVTGTPLQNFEAALQIKRSYEVCAVYSLIVILLVLLMDFLNKEHLLKTFVWPAFAVAGVAAALVACRVNVPVIGLIVGYTLIVFALAALRDWHSVVHCLVAITPPIIGTLLTFGLLAILGIPLNPANLIILPLIIGIGVDNGVHVLHDFHRSRDPVYTPSASLVNAITMTASTSIVGFGSMMISSHRGLYSLGAVLSLGVISCVALALVTLPAFLALYRRSHQPPVDGEQEQPEEPRQAAGPPTILPINQQIRVA